ncbi:uncharacterized protein DUF4376 [Palleronia aestuarii]|uniref:Uncharacterized protein DUF4376 n=1 Tax=Palleronia aestuarii TaxID=568105 RepID=A0A2W7NNV8_9RHOB|nr:DUF4376 domain-containing protein [Palleronia aestuarii]PZX19827.1 uncharacterized protein DUF4376 [Palleronia aestuarii]
MPEFGQSLEAVRLRRIYQELAAYRWSIEVGGITYEGVPHATDDRSKTLINGRVAAMENGSLPAPVEWKAADGSTVTFQTAAEFNAFANAVARHVAQCFQAETFVAQELQFAADPRSVDLEGRFDSRFTILKAQ